MTAVVEAPVEVPTSTVVRLWCGTCHALVPIRPSWVSFAPRRTTVQHVTPAAWADRYATHTTSKGAA